MSYPGNKNDQSFKQSFAHICSEVPFKSWTHDSHGRIQLGKTSITTDASPVTCNSDITYSLS